MGLELSAKWGWVSTISKSRGVQEEDGVNAVSARGLSSPISLGFKSELALYCFALVPEGHSTIAQRFSVGIDGRSGTVPKGRLRNATRIQPSLRDLESFARWTQR